MTAPTPAFVELEERSLFASLYLMRDELGTDDPTVKSLLGRKAPATLAHELATTSKLYDPAVRKALLLGGQAAVDASKDPMVLFAKALDPEVLAVRKRIEDEVTGPRARASERVAQAYFAVHQKDTYPDATFTLRLSYGSVKGWVRRDGVTIEPFTTIDGVFARATGEDPYVLPKTWLAAKAKLNGSTPFNFVTDNDIVGGNSGSPMVDKEGRVVGLAFDGNIESIGGNYWFDETVNRCVGVHPAAIVEALRVVYGAGALADELTKSAPNGKM